MITKKKKMQNYTILALIKYQWITKKKKELKFFVVVISQLSKYKCLNFSDIIFIIEITIGVYFLYYWA